MTKISEDFTPPYNAQLARQAKPPKRTFLNDETSFKNALAVNLEAMRKLKEAIQWFFKYEMSMEEIMRNALRKFSDATESI